MKLEAGILSHTKSTISLTNALVKHEAEHMPDIEMRGVTWSYKPEVLFISSKLIIVYYQATIYGDAYGL